MTEFAAVLRIKTLKQAACEPEPIKPKGCVRKDNAPLGDQRFGPRRINIANRDIPSAMEQLAASWKKKS